MARKRQKPTSRKLLSFEFKDRPRRALLWKKATYELWFRFAKVHQRNGGKIPRAFGDLSKFTFEEWWRHEKYGFELFCEPVHEDLVSVADGRTKATEDSILMKVRMNADTDLILRDFKILLNRLQTHNEYQSKARFQPSHSQKQIKLEKLAEALNAYITSESMLHRRAIHKLYDIRPAELPKYERQKTHILMDEKYAASDKSKAARRLRDGRLMKLRNVATANLDSGVTLSGASDNSDSGVWSIVQHRLKRVPNALYENWVVRKTRLLSRQRKVARDVFKSIENGTFP